MSNYRGARWLDQAITAVLRQSHERLELIIVDDASGDDSVSIIRRAMQDDPRVKLIECPTNLGPSGARNLALEAAQGVWVAIVDSDDLMHPARIERMVQAARHLCSDAVADDMIFFGETPAVGGRTLLQSLDLTAARRLSLAEFIASDNGGSGLPAYGYLKPLIRRDAMAGLRYDPTLRVGEDFDLYARLLAGGLHFCIIPDAMYLYRRHSASLSHRLTTEVLVPLNAAHARLEMAVPKGDADMAAALRQRRDALNWALLYAQLVTALKGGSLATIVRLLSRHPRLVKPFWQSLQERLARRRDGVSAPERTSMDLVLLPAGQQLTAALSATIPADARMITVPRLAKPGAALPASLAPLAAELSDLASRHLLDVLAVGPEGRHALGMLPPVAHVRFWPDTAD